MQRDLHALREIPGIVFAESFRDEPAARRLDSLALSTKSVELVGLLGATTPSRERKGGNEGMGNTAAFALAFDSLDGDSFMVIVFLVDAMEGESASLPAAGTLLFGEERSEQ